MDAVLYSFRRCPYAMRARMALRYAGCAVQIHEISLKAKPPEMLERSPKGTVPVLVMGDRVLEQSLDIMHWALAQNDPDNWLLISDGEAAGRFRHWCKRMIRCSNSIWITTNTSCVTRNTHRNIIGSRLKCFCKSWKRVCSTGTFW